ncbi:AAA family ATPase [Desulfobacula phenolica]|uniref:AAA family ATPase n=1 Tax=Desulfobacula phenolica TaxID=90732 RepID=UPI001FE1FBEC|nr:AAA family ATPase [Desulfobacula phenolica]
MTLIYELGKGKQARTLLFDNPGDQGSPGWWQSNSSRILFPPEFRTGDWQAEVTKAIHDDGHWEPLIKDGNWPGKRVGLPRTILAYTSGHTAPWESIFYLEPSASNSRMDIVSQAADYDTSQERPFGWTLQKEIDFLGQTGIQEKQDAIHEIKKIQEEFSSRESDQEICLFITPLLLKFALIAVSLPLSMEELRKYENFVDKILRHNTLITDREKEPGLPRLFHQVGWLWPVCISFTADFNPDDWSEMERSFKSSLFQAMLGFASDAIKEPEPSSKRRIFFDLKSKNTADFARSLNDEAMKLHFGSTDAFEYVGDGLLQFLGGKKGQPYDHFKQLLSLYQQGIIEDVQIALKSTHTDDILLFDELSDGEQVYLGRMALFYLMQGRDDALLLLDEPESHFNDVWKREIVSIIDEVLGNQTNEVIISTHSSIALTDVFDDEIKLLKKEDGNAYVSNITSTTFGADPSEIMINIFDADDSIGKRSLEWLNEQLKKEWTPDQKEELEKIIKRIGPGLHRSELRTIWRKLNAL